MQHEILRLYFQIPVWHCVKKKQFKKKLLISYDNGKGYALKFHAILSSIYISDQTSDEIIEFLLFKIKINTLIFKKWTTKGFHCLQAGNLLILFEY